MSVTDPAAQGAHAAAPAQRRPDQTAMEAGRSSVAEGFPPSSGRSGTTPVGDEPSAAAIEMSGARGDLDR